MLFMPQKILFFQLKSKNLTKNVYTQKGCFLRMLIIRLSFFLVKKHE